jgi:Skp family chaperone for outer membrane proteins
MKTKMLVLGCLFLIVALSEGCEYGLEKPKPEADTPALKIGVVNVRKIFRDCKKITSYRQEVIAERNRVEAELEKLDKEIEVESAGLKTLKEGTEEHLKLMKELLAKQANLQAQQKFYDQQMALKEQKVIEQLYENILRETATVAEEKNLTMVLAKDEIDFPALGLNDAMMTVRTNKLLYGGSCLDITDEVMARLDAGN